MTKKKDVSVLDVEGALKEEGRNRRKEGERRLQATQPSLPHLDLEHGPGRTVSIKDIDHGPFQIRSLNAIADLADSIAKDGLLQPITVRHSAKARTSGLPERFEVVAGHRRLEACRSLGHETIRVQVFELDDEAAYRLSLIENMKRVDLNPLEEAQSFKLAITKLGWDDKKVAAAVNRTLPYVKQRLSLLELPKALREQVAIGVSPAKAFSLAPLDQFKRVKGGGPDRIAEAISLKLEVETVHGMKASDEPWLPEATLSQVEDYVAKVFAVNSFEIGKEWDPDICRKNGCLGQVNGSKVCLKLEHAFEVRVAKYEVPLKTVLEEWMRKMASKVGVTPEMQLPIYYDLALTAPTRRYNAERVEQPPQWPACPKPLARSTYNDDKGSAMIWRAFCKLVTGRAREACYACPAWNGKRGPGRGLLVSLERDHTTSYQTEVRVQPLCMSHTCRQKQIELSRDDPEKDTKASARQRKLLAEQPPLVSHAASLVERLTKDRTRLLAAYLLERYKQKGIPELRYRTNDIAKEIGLRVPDHDNTANGALKAMMSVGEEGLFRLIAEYVVRHFDSAQRSEWTGGDQGHDEKHWSPNALQATTSFLFGEDAGDQLKDALKEVAEKK